MSLGFVFVVFVVGFSTTLTVDVLSFSTTKPGIQTDEEENGGDESVGGARQKEGTGREGWLIFFFFFFEHPFFALGFFPKKRGAQECSTREVEVKA